MRLPGMPGPLADRNKLNDLTTPLDQEMRRDTHLMYFLEVRMSIGGEAILEKLFYVVISKLMRGEADGMNNNHVDSTAGRAVIKVWRRHLADTFDQACYRIERLFHGKYADDD